MLCTRARSGSGVAAGSCRRKGNPNGQTLGLVSTPALGLFGLVWLINRSFLTNKQYFPLTSNQLIVLSAMVYQPNKPKRIGRRSSDMNPKSMRPLN